jgi:hypothetical protein
VQLLPLVQQIRNHGARTTLQQVADELNRRNVNTPRGGGQWHPAQVLRILRAA